MAAVRDMLLWDLDEEEAEVYLMKPETVEVLLAHFEEYTTDNIGGLSPRSTAHCLWMMF